MENATKALLIAAAVLITILIISFGIIIYNMASTATDSSSMSEVEVSTFNAKFLQFEGKRVSGSKVNTMLTTVLNNNMQQENDGKKVSITGDITLAKDAKQLPTTKADTGETYTVTLSYSSTSGYVNSIAVDKNE